MSLPLIVVICLTWANHEMLNVDQIPEKLVESGELVGFRYDDDHITLFLVGRPTRLSAMVAEACPVSDMLVGQTAIRLEECGHIVRSDRAWIVVECLLQSLFSETRG